MNVNRRDFLGYGLGLVATAALPGCRTVEKGETLPLFGRRGRWERLNLSYQQVHLGLAQPFSVLHISDTHLTLAGDDEDGAVVKRSAMRTATFGGHQEEALASSLDWAKDNVDFVLHTGDLIDFQSQANFDSVRRHFGGIALGTPGNHEYGWPSNPFRSKVPEAYYRIATRFPLQDAYPYDLAFQAKVVNGVNFVMMDDVFGTVTSAQVERFAAEVKKGLPIVLCMHVPFFTDAIWLANDKFWSQVGRRFRSATVPEARGDFKRQKEDPVTRDFIASLKSQKLLKAILAGHLHIAVQDRFSPTAMQYVVGGNFMFHGQEILFT